jgi:two-component system KDP operon response regulator KdpE
MSNRDTAAREPASRDTGVKAPAPGPRVLIVDDEPQIRRFLRASLQSHDYAVIEAENGKEAVRACTVQRPDLVILDLGLPDMDGLDVISLVREWSTVPVIVLSIRSDDADKIDALDRGANDYVTKPFSMGELLARMRVALRQGGRDATESDPVVVAGEMAIDFARRLVTVNGSPVRLSRKEYDLLRILASHPGKVISHQQLLQEVWGQAYVEETQYLRVYIGQLRQKLERDPASPKHLVTEPGVGYRFVTS